MPNTSQSHPLSFDLARKDKVAVQPVEPTIITINELFWYGATFLPLTAQASSTAQVQVQADADFIVVKQCRFATNSNDNSVVTSPLVTVTLTDTGSGRQLMDSAQHMENIFGTAQFPYICPQVKRLAANSTFQVAVTSLTGAVGYNLYLSFQGYKQYKFKQ